MNRENKLTLAIALIYPVGFFFVWYLVKYTSLEWQRSYDWFGVVLLNTSEPWGSIAYDFKVQMALKDLVGSPYYDYVVSVIVTLGVVLNVFIIKFLIKWAYGKIKRT